MIIPKAIKAINPDAEFSITDNNLDNITWLNGTTPISVLDIQNKINEIQYQLDREAEYPSWQEQMDMQYHDTVNGTTTWKDAIAKVKSDNPK
tara:strand:- start:270 stop:545 length:276 start_codon:yes stop_codon:yes gene_type:complete